MLMGFVLLFAAIVALLFFAYAGWRRATSREKDLQIWGVMRRAGIAPQDGAGGDAQMAQAVRRCVLCPSIEECDHWLASGKREGLGAFCPNAGFFAQQKGVKEAAKR
jgi:hypothetical protein